MTAAADPVRAHDLLTAARHLVEHPLVLAEREPGVFQLIRRHEHDLDRWFTQRFGYRLQVAADTARLFKTTVVARRRPLRTAASRSRPMSGREHTMLALALAATSAGASVTSLRDLIQEIRSTAVEAGVAVTEEAADRRALVVALRWMVHHGAVVEMHDRVDRYATDSTADAVLRIRPDRVALLPLPALAAADTVEQLLDRSDRRLSSRQWMRSILLEEPVLYRSDLASGEWSELRRRLGAESGIFGEMFGLHIEARAEGVCAVDEDGRLTDSRFPRGGTVGHAALLLVDRLAGILGGSGGAGVQDSADGPDSAARRGGADGLGGTGRSDDAARRGTGVAVAGDGIVDVERSAVVEMVSELAAEHRRHWSKALGGDPERLTGEILGLLADHRLAETLHDSGAVRFLPAVWRYGVAVASSAGSDADGVEQTTLL